MNYFFRLSKLSFLTALLAGTLGVLVVVVIVAKLVTPNNVFDPSLPIPPSGFTWHKVFEDNFNSTALDSNKWVTCYDWFEYDQSGCTNEGNSELEWYIPESVKVGDEVVTLNAKRQTINGWSNGQPKIYEYTSGMISTGRSSSKEKPKWTGTYGYYQARLKIPKGKGLWPAFWLVPANKSWPPEIDIMESLGDQPEKILQTYFWNSGQVPPPMDTSTYSGTDFSNIWHTFGLNWQPGRLDWYIDGVLSKSATSPNVPSLAMEIIVNLAVGGKLPGSPDASTVFPATMYIDYIKVSQLVAE